LSDRAAEQHFAHAEALTRKHVLEIGAVGRVEARALRDADIAAVEREHEEIADVAGQLALDVLQQGVVRGGLRGVERYGAAQSRHQRIEIAEMIVDLRGKQARLRDGAFGGGRAVAAPLRPKAAANERGERNDGREHESEQARSNATQHHDPDPAMAGTHPHARELNASRLYVG
jgi:hypothetical protein